MEQVRKLLRLSRADRRLLVGATLAVAAVRLTLALAGFAAVRRWTAQRTGRGPTRANDPRCPPPPERIAWAVDVAGRHLPGRTTCLARALAAEFLLHRHGHPARLRISVARQDQERPFQAHAWVETGGRVLHDTPSAGFEPLPALGPDDP